MSGQPATRRLLGSRNAGGGAGASSSGQQQQQQQSAPATAQRNINTAPEDLDSNEVKVLDIAKYISGSGGFSDWLDRDLVAGGGARKYRFAPELSKSGALLHYYSIVESV